MLVVPERRLSVAVVGAGLCGMATTYHLLARGHMVTVFDGACNRGLPIGNEGHYATASAVAAGLLHPLSPRLKMTWQGEEALDLAMQLVEAAGSEQIVTTRNVYRPFRDEADREAAIQAAAKLGPKQLEILDGHSLAAAVPWSAETNLGGARIVRACVIDAQEYMRSLWQVCETNGASWEVRHITNIDELFSEYDRLVFCGGALGLGNKLLGKETKLVRGQSLLFNALQEHDNSVALLRGDYIAPLAKPSGTYVLGATRERIPSFDDSLSHGVDSPDTLLSTHLKQAVSTMAPRNQFSPKTTTAGVRLDGPKTNFGRLPVLAVPRPGLVLAGALGSRGLLRHAQVGALAAELASLDLEANYTEYIPPPLRMQTAANSN